MSDNEESLQSGVVPVYRVAVVRESGICEPPTVSVRKSSEAAKVLRPLFAKLDREQFVVLLLDAQHKAIGVNIVSIGSLTASLVHARETFKPAILSNSAAIIVAHNSRKEHVSQAVTYSSGQGQNCLPGFNNFR